ncbi:DUF1127 domain-containing protein [Parasedimentitalea marina]|uniref:DUF1127 domain-containing protein n=1 Tax=Parasedimentitalea marina TaxID=2483033 RepID=A0A3T0N4D0_9RHOB|nr:DUF1127 domain-containing protein [Parasedimentitalea marina]AZV78878.1 DUF1127 domain-containing protein [Parasedimentitalea marina]
MTYISSTCTTASRRPTLLADLITRFAVARQRRALASLDDSALKDIGLTRLEADTEGKRRFWDAPDSWRC